MILNLNKMNKLENKSKNKINPISLKNKTMTMMTMKKKTMTSMRKRMMMKIMMIT